MKKTILITLTLLLTSCNENTSNSNETTETETSPTVAQSEVAKEPNEPLSYHDVFKEPEAPQTTMEQIVERQEIADFSSFHQLQLWNAYRNDNNKIKPL